MTLRHHSFTWCIVVLQGHGQSIKRKLQTLELCKHTSARPFMCTHTRVFCIFRYLPLWFSTPRCRLELLSGNEKHVIRAGSWQVLNQIRIAEYIDIDNAIHRSIRIDTEVNRIELNTCAFGHLEESRGYDHHCSDTVVNLLNVLHIQMTWVWNEHRGNSCTDWTHVERNCLNCCAITKIE